MAFLKGQNDSHGEEIGSCLRLEWGRQVLWLRRVEPGSLQWSGSVHWLEPGTGNYTGANNYKDVNTHTHKPECLENW